MVNKEFIVAIYVGHGKSTDGSWDPGCVYKNYTEAALMLPIVQSAVRHLEYNKITVLSDAFNANNMNARKQIAEANAKGADLFMSVHCDFSKAPTGTLPLYLSESGRKLVVAVNQRVSAYMGLKTRAYVKRTDLLELNTTKMTACIFETGSIKADLNTLKNKPELYGKAIAHGICDYLGVKFKDKDAVVEEKPVTKPVTTTITSTTKKLTIDGLWGSNTTKMTEKVLGLKQTGTIKGQLKSCRKYLPNCQTSGWKFVTASTSGSVTIKAIQKLVGVKQDGKAGKDTVKGMQKFLKTKKFYTGSIDGICGKATVMAWQKYVNSKL